jgi:MYXO-CTERM domain-containing protein
MLSKRISKMLLSGATVGMMAGAANAALNIDVRATGVTGGGTVANGKLVNNVAVGSVVTFDIFAVITGTNASTTDDKFISVSGSYLTTGPLHGNLLADVVRTPLDSDGVAIPPLGFDANGFSVGLQQDLDGDGDLDVGSTADSAANNFWAARFFGAPNGSPAGSTNPTTNGRRIGFGTFTVTSATGATILNFDGRDAGTAGNWIEDGQTLSAASQNGVLGITINGTGGGTIPEPATLSLAGLAGLAMVRRRRA